MRGRIAVFVHHPYCAVDSINGIMTSLSPHYDFKVFTRHELEDNVFDDVDVLAFAGGLGDSDRHEYLFRNNGNHIQQYLRRGGRYLGICMGAYWAGPDYFNLLGPGVDVSQYIKRPAADIRRSYSTTARVTWQGQQDRMYFYDGCAITGDERNMDVVARYANGDAMAIIKNRIGIIGCHLESQHSWYDRKYLAPHWHDGRHHALLLNFVDRLMEK
jgi:glutamine amidotransferase-like uncharacterized protein